MKLSHIYLYVASGVLLTSFAVALTLYYQPEKIENLDSMLYCACGYSRVKFASGKILMVHFHHESVKPGDQIGTYHVSGTSVEMDTIFGTVRRHDILKLDHIGIIEPPAPEQIYDYRAINRNSWKLRVYAMLRKVGSKLGLDLTMYRSDPLFVTLSDSNVSRSRRGGLKRSPNS